MRVIVTDKGFANVRTASEPSLKVSDIVLVMCG